ncbi:unnamed protein product [Nezara viridula]|uniref:Uncharacterized protein n=1 Tax=Nezara viridula TaxID=85310 RepID=A0A9P0E9X8_NEZVI|nr:unnamed protein product [Nezara viridula]
MPGGHMVPARPREASTLPRHGRVPSKECPALNSFQPNRFITTLPVHHKFRETFGEREFTVRGLWFGSRGTIPRRTRSFLEELGVDIKDVARLAEI